MPIDKIETPRGVPVYFLDEHHEAFIAWWLHFTQTPSSLSRTLIHIDEHADFGMPHLTLPVPSSGTKLNEVEEFVYKQLSIGTFLIPAAAVKFFSNLIWVRPSNEFTEEATEIHLGISKTTPFLSFNSSADSVTFLQYSSTSWDKALDSSQEWMLDICLDSFFCNEKLTPDPFLLEITPAQFQLLNKAQLNVWNMRYGSAARVYKNSGVCFFELDLASWSSPECLDLRTDMEERLNKLNVFLSKLKQMPLMVTISRSVKSGYVPLNMAKYLENRIVAIIRAIF